MILLSSIITSSPSPVRYPIVFTIKTSLKYKVLYSSMTFITDWRQRSQKLRGVYSPTQQVEVVVELPLQRYRLMVAGRPRPFPMSRSSRQTGLDLVMKWVWMQVERVDLPVFLLPLMRIFLLEGSLEALLMTLVILSGQQGQGVGSIYSCSASTTRGITLSKQGITLLMASLQIYSLDMNSTSLSVTFSSVSNTSRMVKLGSIREELFTPSARYRAPAQSMALMPLTLQYLCGSHRMAHMFYCRWTKRGVASSSSTGMTLCFLGFGIGFEMGFFLLTFIFSVSGEELQQQGMLKHLIGSSLAYLLNEQ